MPKKESQRSGRGERYECVMEPLDTWMVWDNRTGEPAMSGDRLCLSLSETEARSACALLNCRAEPDPKVDRKSYH